MLWNSETILVSLDRGMFVDVHPCSAPRQAVATEAKPARFSPQHLAHIVPDFNQIGSLSAELQLNA